MRVVASMSRGLVRQDAEESPRTIALAVLGACDIEKARHAELL
jgi:hypothetical protein